MIAFPVAGAVFCFLLLLLGKQDSVCVPGIFMVFLGSDLIWLFAYGYATRRGIMLTTDSLIIHRFLRPNRPIQPSEIGWICVVGWGPFSRKDHAEDYKIGIVGASFELERVDAFGPAAYVSRTHYADGALMAAVEYDFTLLQELVSRYPCPVYLSDSFCRNFPDEVHRMISSSGRTLEHQAHSCVCRK